MALPYLRHPGIHTIEAINEQRARKAVSTLHKWQSTALVMRSASLEISLIELSPAM